MDFNFNKHSLQLFEAFNDPQIRLIVSYGGTSSGKSISILQLLTIYALNRRVHTPVTITCVAETYPVLRRGIIKDWKGIVMGDAYDPSRWNGSSSTYTFPNNSIIQFVSGDNPQKFRGMRSHVVYFDEITNIKQEAFKQLSMRTRKKVIASFNPSHEFFIKDEMARADCKVIHTTYKDNEFVDAGIIAELESRAKMDENFKRVYVDGNWGVYEGNIFDEGTDYQITKGIPSSFNGARTTTLFGLDWGFSNDPTSLVECVLKHTDDNLPDELFIKEHLYETGLINSEINKIIKLANPHNIEIIADSAAPKDIEDFKRTYRMNMSKAYKPPGSILSGINQLKELHIFIDSESSNIIKEFRNYTWATNSNGEQTGKPIDSFNHAIDAIRYATYFLIKKTKRSGITSELL